ncbi:MAG: bifunctional glutamate N-acetyltransferase/amino-acid acetyltransferase ArgJ, partial [Nitrospirae bacterium]|nr:bifunctional glutamate N-acetyltransferase/amino-acid acetyltransferase ArgJ [Nitrospirota bacterium]
MSFKKKGTGVTAPKGFRAGGIACGIKKSGALDLALLVSDVPASATGTFTRNRFRASCVDHSERLARRGRARAVIVNSGNANAATGKQGKRDTAEMAKRAASAFDVPAGEVLVASTGVIGVPLPMAAVLAGIERLVERLDEAGGRRAARAIMTTDSVPKETSERRRLGGASVTVGGMAKGSGMIHPNMATMLAFITTDANVSAPVLRKILLGAVDDSFNAITVDGETSTNDMVLCLANGAAGGAAVLAGRDLDVFAGMLGEVCRDLAEKIVRDGEGASKFIRVVVTGAASVSAARRVARAVAVSPLVKTAVYGGDPNWGRIAAAAGNAGVAFRPENVSIRVGGVPIVRRGEGLGAAAER